MLSSRPVSGLKRRTKFSSLSSNGTNIERGVLVNRLPAHAAVGEPDRREPGRLGPDRQVGALVGAGVIVVGRERQLEQARPVDIALVHLGDGQPEPGRLEIVAVVLARVVDEDEAGRHGNADGHLRPALDDDRLDDRRLLAVDRPVRSCSTGAGSPAGSGMVFSAGVRSPWGGNGCGCTCKPSQASALMAARPAITNNTIFIQLNLRARVGNLLRQVANSLLPYGGRYPSLFAHGLQQHGHTADDEQQRP